MITLANIIGGAAIAALLVVFYALGVTAGREATQQREEDISMEHTLWRKRASSRMDAAPQSPGGER